MRWSELPPRSNLSYSTWALSTLLLALPAIILGLLASRTGSVPVAVGAGVEAMFLLVFFRVHPVWRPPVSVSVVVLYLIALVWAWLPLRGSTDWAPHVERVPPVTPPGPGAGRDRIGPRRRAQRRLWRPPTE